jgi:hypothetical protein
MILTNREKKNYFGDHGQGNKINKAKHLEIKDVLSYSCRSGITKKNWVIIRINDDGRKEIVALEQLEQEHPELIEEHVERSVSIEWLPILSSTRRFYDAYVDFDHMVHDWET